MKNYKEIFEEYEMEKEVKERENQAWKQFTPKETNDRIQKWDINNTRAQLVHFCIVEMMAIDTQTFYIVEDISSIVLLKGQ